MEALGHGGSKENF
jgi:hypothetical protein